MVDKRSLIYMRLMSSHRRRNVKAEIDKWGPLIKKAGVYAD